MANSGPIMALSSKSLTSGKTSCSSTWNTVNTLINGWKRECVILSFDLKGSGVVLFHPPPKKKYIYTTNLKLCIDNVRNPSYSLKMFNRWFSIGHFISEFMRPTSNIKTKMDFNMNPFRFFFFFIHLSVFLCKINNFSRIVSGGTNHANTSIIVIEGYEYENPKLELSPKSSHSPLHLIKCPVNN